LLLVGHRTYEEALTSMGVDTTPGPDDLDPEGRDDAPRWFLILGALILGIGVIYFMWVFFYAAGTL
jgi:hypothetical protein